MLLLTIHIVAIVGPDSGKHNSLPDCVVNCAPWHCPLLCPLLFLFCFLLSIISYGQSCVTGVQNFLYQEISASSISHAGIFLARVLYSHGKVWWHVMMSMNTTIYMFVARDPFMEFLRDNKRYAKSHYIDDLADNLKFLLNKCVITLLTDRKSAAHIYIHITHKCTRADSRLWTWMLKQINI